MRRRNDLVARRRAAVARGVAVALPLVVQEASGSLLRDGEGREVIDFAEGIGCVNVGHAHPAVVTAITAQAARCIDACFQVATYEPYVALAERLNALVPGPGTKKTLLVNTGAEAVENAIKIARVATGRPAVVALSTRSTAARCFRRRHRPDDLRQVSFGNPRASPTSGGRANSDRATCPWIATSGGVQKRTARHSWPAGSSWSAGRQRTSARRGPHPFGGGDDGRLEIPIAHPGRLLPPGGLY